MINGVADKVEAMGPAGVAYFSAVYIAAEILALPAVPLTASAGYLFGAVEGTAVVLFSATIAAGVSFLIGRQPCCHACRICISLLQGQRQGQSPREG